MEIIENKENKGQKVDAYLGNKQNKQMNSRGPCKMGPRECNRELVSRQNSDVNTATLDKRRPSDILGSRQAPDKIPGSNFKNSTLDEVSDVYQD